MQQADKPEFLKVLNGIAAIKRTQLTPEALDLWWGCMADWSIEDFKAATFQVLKRTDFMPMPNHFEDLRRAGRMTASEAWDIVLRHVRTGAYRERPTIGPVIDQCVRATVGGYGQLAQSDESELHWLEKRFTSAYETQTDVQETRTAVPQVTLHAADITPRLAADLKRLTAKVAS